MFTKKDKAQFEDRNVSLEKVNNQLQTFQDGIPYVNVVTAASIDNGIEIISLDEQKKLITLYDAKKNKLDIVKFIPASGAATRMFKFLHSFITDYNHEEESFRDYVKSEGKSELKRFFGSLQEFAFVNENRKKIRELYPNYKFGLKGERNLIFAKTLLGEDGLNFGKMPKGLIPFHRYSKYSTTAFEEHLYETTFFGATGHGAHLHFTFAEDHVRHFKKEFKAVKNRVGKKTNTTFHITYSYQKKETDTLAVSMNNKPLRDTEKNLLFRPSGHGALLENLNDVDADVIFIKNIDNVMAEEFVPEIAYYKKLLAGKLLWLQKFIFKYLNNLDQKNQVSQSILNEIKSFLWNELNIKNIPESAEGMFQILNRPLRVCGVVPNMGAPGGGPFWVKNPNDEISLQIVEMAQMDTEDDHQKTIINEATHFNPVDLVCGVRDYKGKKFDLTKFNDPTSGFISNKTYMGKPIKALELPGLWNGAMANWNTVFIEVPSETFSPVKTVNDLLKKEHRPLA